MLPKLKLSQVFHSRELILRELLEIRKDSKVIDDRFVKSLRQSLLTYEEDKANEVEDWTEYADNAAQTCLLYKGEKTTIELFRVIAAQLAARRDDLIIGPLDRHVQMLYAEWIPMEVLRVQQAVWKGTLPGAELTLECLGGKPAGYIFKKKFPENWLGFLAYRVGFSRVFEYNDDPRHFIGLRFWGMVVSSEDPGAIDFSDWDVDKQCKAHNKSIIRLRLRNEITRDVECPFDFQDDCILCEKSQSDCIASFHRSHDVRAAKVQQG